ncbi:MAG TPA: ribose 5-phosphate isomerase A [Miltoncostaeaceae bacterium]|nr:ribose 5-phosphate isomerase A [Miltoncostaeaceae bacterium]
MDDRAHAWAAAGEHAAALIEDGMRVGLGTGRAAAAGIRALGARVQAGLRVDAVATSRASAELARELGISLVEMGPPLDLAFDGADAVDPRGLVIKGAGGAHVRERVVADAARRFLVLVDRPKIVANLDEWGLLPLAVVPFAVARVMNQLSHLSPSVRGELSDDGMGLIDVRVPNGGDWERVAAEARALAGVLDHGLFRVPLANVIVGAPDGTAASAG